LKKKNENNENSRGGPNLNYIKQNLKNNFSFSFLILILFLKKKKLFFCFVLKNFYKFINGIFVIVEAH
jgi:hypothetical protein